MKTETLGPIRILRALDGRHASVRHGGQSTYVSINDDDPTEVERMVDAELEQLRYEARETLVAIDARQSQRAAAAHPGPAVAAGDYGQPPRRSARGDGACVFQEPARSTPLEQSPGGFTLEEEAGVPMARRVADLESRLARLERRFCLELSAKGDR